MRPTETLKAKELRSNWSSFGKAATGAGFWDGRGQRAEGQRAEGRGHCPRGLQEIEGMRLRAANQVGGLSILALHPRHETSLNVLHVTMADS